jgi:hypothetical protein
MCMLPHALFSQNSPKTGNFTIEIYGGIPNWANALIYPTIQKRFDNVENFGSKGSIWSYGGRISYFIQDRVSVGLDVNHEVSGCYFEYKKLEENTQIYIDFKADYTSRKTRFLLRTNFHVIKKENFDAYIGLGIGYKYVKRTFSATEPNFDDKKLNITGAIFPLTGRISFGTRYFFTNNIGIFTELGFFGGSLLQGGLTVKI